VTLAEAEIAGKAAGAAKSPKKKKSTRKGKGDASPAPVKE